MRRASDCRASTGSASLARALLPPLSPIRRHSGRGVILPPGLDSYRDKIRLVASRSLDRSPSRVIATCGVFLWSGRIPCCGGLNPEKYPWLTQLLARRPFKVVAIALANKMARIAWALLASGGHYRPRLAAA